MRRIFLLILAFLLMVPGLSGKLRAQSDGLPRGAYRMPYVRYEADTASYGGGAFLKGPTFHQDSTASEASQKKYVELPVPGSYVSWTLQHPAEGVVLRFSMPDSEYGGGVNGGLVVYVNEEESVNLPLTSYHAWQYFDKSPGSDRHPSNDPDIGNPRMRFDEARFKIPGGAFPGDVIRLQKTDDDGIAYGIDFIEMEEIDPPVEKPEGFIDVTQPPFNAMPDDVNDDYAAISAALEEAARQGTGIYIPPGQYRLSNRLNISRDHTCIQGAGIWHTEIRFTLTQRDYGGIYADASYIRVSDLYLTTAINLRGSYRAFGNHWGKNSLIENVWMTHFSVGLWIADYTDPTMITEGLTVRNCRIRNTYADGCNFAKGSSQCILEHCDVRNNCDDGLATWSSDKDRVGPTTHNTFRFNTVEFVTRAAGVGIFGGQQHLAHHCLIRDIFAGAGIRVNSTFEAWPFSNTSEIRIFEMSLERCGTRYSLWDNKIGALDINVRYYDVQNIRFSNIDVFDAQADGLYINDANSAYRIDKVHFDEILFRDAASDKLGPGFGISVDNELKGSIQTTGVRMEGSMTADIYEQAPGFEIIDISTSGNQRPVADAGEDVSLEETATSWQLNGTGSSDPEGEDLQYEWIQVAGPPVEMNNPGAERPLVNGLSPNEDYLFRLRVFDGVLSDADVIKVSTELPVGRNVNKSASRIVMRIFPNPAGHSFRVLLSGSRWETTGLMILNMQGRCVHQEMLTASGQRVDVSELLAGVYVVMLNAGEVVYLQKFVKRG